MVTSIFKKFKDILQINNTTRPWMSVVMMGKETGIFKSFALVLWFYQILHIKMWIMLVAVLVGFPLIVSDMKSKRDTE